MSITGYSKPLTDILTVKRQYVIPRYQREYVWDTKQWEDLYTDLKLNYLQYLEDNRKESHFLGNIVILEEPKEFYTIAHVIDGQQRLTTLFLLLLAIMRKCNLIGTETAKAQFWGIKKILKDSTTSGVEFDKFTNDDNPYFKTILNTCAKYHENTAEILDNCDITKKRYVFEEKYLCRCFLFMFQKISDDYDNGIIDISKFANRVLNSIVIETKSTNIKESYTVFEILNARGKPLENHELIKNYIMRYYETNHPDIALNKWKELTEFLRKNKIGSKQFFDHYVSHMYDKSSEKKSGEKQTAFEYVKNNNKENNTANLLEDFSYKAKLYALFHNPEINFNGSSNTYCQLIKDNLRFFRGRNQTQFRPLFLSLFNRLYSFEDDPTKRNLENDKKLAEITLFLERFYFIFGIVLNEQPKVLEKSVHNSAFLINTCPEIDLDEQIKKLKEALATLLPDYITFEQAFLNLGYSNKNARYGDEEGNKKDIQYIIANYEKYLRGNNEELPPFSIEHIYKDSGEDKHCKIGNLMCLEEPLNTLSGNKTVKTKVEKTYPLSSFLSPKQIIKDFTGTFDEPEIIARGKAIASILFESVWKEKMKIINSVAD